MFADRVVASDANAAARLKTVGEILRRASDDRAMSDHIMLAHFHIAFDHDVRADHTFFPD